MKQSLAGREGQPLSAIISITAIKAKGINPKGEGVASHLSSADGGRESPEKKGGESTLKIKS